MSTSPSNTDRLRIAFTLVELLVSISIIGVLGWLGSVHR